MHKNQVNSVHVKQNYTIRITLNARNVWLMDSTKKLTFIRNFFVLFSKRVVQKFTKPGQYGSVLTSKQI